VCGRTDVQLFSAGLGGAVCAGDAEPGAGHVSAAALTYMATLALADLADAGDTTSPDGRTRKEARALLFGFAEYHLERRMKSVPMLLRTAP
jgi:DNA repair protein RecO (recombination protein O)